MIIPQKQSTVGWVRVVLQKFNSTLNAHMPVLGVTYDKVTVKCAKAGDTTLTALSLTSGDWRELGGGEYEVNVSTTAHGTVGQVTVQVWPKLWEGSVDIDSGDASAPYNTFDTDDLTEANDYYNGFAWLWTYGDNKGQWTTVADFVAATDTVTLTDAATNTIDAGDCYWCFSHTFDPVHAYYTVQAANVYDSDVAGNDKRQVDAVEISSDSTAADNLEADYDGTGYAKANSSIATAASVTDPVKVGELQPSALADLFDTDSGKAYDDAVAGSAIREIAENASAAIGESDKDDIADRVWDEAQSGHATAGTFGSHLDAPVSDIGSQTGSGALDVTVTCQDGGGSPLDGVAVWISTDSGGDNVVAGTKYTNANGQVAFKLDAGTYWVHRQLAGYEFSPNPKQETVS